MYESTHSYKILVVDDDEHITQLLDEFLSSRGYQVEVAHNSLQAMEKVRLYPDAILLDRVLEGSVHEPDGLKVCETIRMEERYSQIPIIFVSALGAPSQRIEGLHMGADDYIAKPFDREELIARIDVVIRRSQLFEQGRERKYDALCELKNIIENKKIQTFFQPIFDLSDMRTIGVEALNRPEQGFVIKNADILYQAAVYFGLYYDLEMVAWHKSIKQWQEQANSSVLLFLNCSPYLIEWKEFDENVIFKDAGVDPKQVALEITERLSIKNYEMFFHKLDRLKNAGFQIAIDDMGQGFSSIERVARLKPTFVKIDKGLVDDVDTDDIKRKIIESIVSFCRADIVCIAEGIERIEQLKVLKELGVTAGQGYLLKRPSMDLNILDWEKGAQSLLKAY